MELTGQSKTLFKGTLILTVAALLTKILSAIYRVPFQNIVGDVGFYIYQQVYPFYGIAIALSTYGFPVVISKLYAEEIEKGKEGNPRQLVGTSIIFLYSFGFIGSALLYGLSNSLAQSMQDPQLAPLLRLVSIVFLIMPAISLFRGVFQGYGDMMPTAVSQVSEQLIRVVTILATAFILVNQHASLYTVGAGAVFGSITGGITSVIILFTFAYKLRRKVPLVGRIQFQQTRNILKRLITQGLPICISSMLLVLIQLADSLNLYSLLIDSGIHTTYAKELKGVYDRGQPLIQLGTVVATSMSLSLVPLITKEKMHKNVDVLREKIQLALKTSILVGVGATMGLYSIIKPTNTMLFEDNAGSQVLAMLTVVILLASIIMTATAVLQGLGHTYFPAMMVLVAFLLKYGLNAILVPAFGTFGASIASVLSLLSILVLFIVKLHKIMGKPMLDMRFYVMNVLSAFAMVVVLKLYLISSDFIYDFGYSERLMSSIQAITALIVGGLVYIALMIKTQLLTEKDLYLLPFGSKLMFFLPKKSRRGRVDEKN
ncbi:putative polysaccharide biosynthesis protein [Niallia sp. Krafla_26]|uniref:putative polysaccharide biosynthesis protein n=1 Tax=Niallia sp. Krafla_26 TaxID=3064703 RepID=UPI003D17E9B8